MYHRPADPEVPLVCLDEFCKQLLGETRSAVAASPGKPKRIDYEYTRHGSVSGFMISLPHRGERHVYFGDEGRRTAQDFAHCLDYLANELLADAPRIVLVMDNLNIHRAASLYQYHPAEKAFRLWQRFEVHYTPVHGSWLNMAEIEIGLMARRCLDRHIDNFATIKEEVAAYTTTKNASPKPINWQFTHNDARTKLQSLYPSTYA